MDDLIAARLQMASTLGFHIIFASIGIAMPFFMAASHRRWIITQDKTYLTLTKIWSKGVAIFFAVGAVSGTVLAFELGLLWPEFMKHAGPIIGMPFSWEGTAFFLEAIALGLFLYGWEKLPPKIHWLCGLAVGICGVSSGLFVICANGWMNSPTGFEWKDGQALNIDPVRAMFNPAAFWQGIHMTVAAFQATAVAVAGMHAFLLLRGHTPKIHAAALKIATIFFIVASLVQPLTGDLLAKDVAKRQPLKLAAMESLFKTQQHAPLLIGGIPNLEQQKVNYGIELPSMLSFLAKADFSAEVQGLTDFPRSEWPPVLIVHFAFQIMVAVGFTLVALAILLIYILWRAPRLLEKSWLLKILALSTPLGFIAIEAGWVVTEVGRQPWIIYKIMKTSDAVTPVPGIIYSFIISIFIYISLSYLIIRIMRRQVRALDQLEGSATS